VERLRRKGDFVRAFRKGRRLDGALFLMIAVANDLGHPRLGLAAGKRVGDAVRRNRAKRVLREIFRHNKERLAGIDLVLVAKPGVERAPVEEVEREYRRRLGQLAGRRVWPRRPVAARPD
jgi:ribonuclease P protein component